LIASNQRGEAQPERVSLWQMTTDSCCSEGDVKEFRGAFTMLKPVCQDAERKCLGFGIASSDVLP
jgi:hypothetical protein